MEIKNFSNTFLDDIIKIEKQSFKNPWTKEMFLSSAKNEAVDFKVMAENGVVAGYCISQTVCDEMEILSIAVAPEFRRRSLGKDLLKSALEEAKNKKAATAFLEVRESNNIAINLYLSLGFDKIGIRKKYYTDEDAIVLRKII